MCHGKVSGAVVGGMLGGPIGAVVGAQAVGPNLVRGLGEIGGGESRV